MAFKDISGIVALIGVVFTAGVVFTTMSGDISQLKTKVSELEENQTPEKRYVPIRRFQSFGQDVEEGDSSVDKRYFADDQCKVGNIVVGEVNPPSTDHQPAICFCSTGPAHGLGKGWFCID